MDLFKLKGTIEVDNDAAIDALEETSKEGEKTQGKLSKFFSGIGKGALAVGKTIGVGMAAGGAAMATLTVKAMNLGGELEQNMGGSEAVFKKYATNVQETAKKAFSNMGLSTSDYLATANKMGALFQGAGFNIKESMDLSSDAMQRAADVASIMGIDTNAAMEAIAGAAKGNFTMMDNLGVAMNDTTLNAYALEKGINKTTQEMTNQEKIGLAMEMFMDKTAYAAGNYAKENETLAGSLGTAKSALTNFLDGSGSVEDLVTSFSNFANVIVNQLGELAPRLVTGITDIINQIMPMLPPLLQQLLPIIIDGAVSLINGLVTALPSIITALMDALPALIEGVQKIINALIEALPQIIQALVSALPTLIPMLIDAIVNIIVTICNQFSSIIQPLIDALPTIIISIVEALMKNLPALIKGVITLVLGIVKAIPQIIQSLVDALPEIISLIVEALLTNLPLIIEGLIQVVWEIVCALPQIFTSLVEGILNIFVGIWDGICNAFSGVGTWFADVFGAAWEGIKKAWSAVTSWFSGIWDGIKKVFSVVGNWFADIFKKAWEGIKKAWSAVTGWFSNIWSGIKNIFSAVGNWFSNIFSKAWQGIKRAWSGVKNFFSGIWSGIKNVFSSVTSWFGNIFKKAWEAIKKPFAAVGNFFSGIFNKIKNTFKEVGVAVGKAIGGAFKNAINAVIATVEGAINLVPKAINGAISLINKLPGVEIGKIPTIELPRLAKGGVVDKATPAIFGEDGAEAVVPLEKNTGWMNKVAEKIHSFMFEVKSSGFEKPSTFEHNAKIPKTQIENAVVDVKTEIGVVSGILDRILMLLAQYFPDVLESLDRVPVWDTGVAAAQLAPAMNVQLGIIKSQEERGR